MTSFLEGSLKKALAQGFRGKLSRGTIRRYTYTLNDQGDRVPGAHSDYSFEGTRDDFDARYREQAGIPETDVRVLVILGLTTVTPQQTDKIFIKSRWHEVRQVLAIDPAGATATLQCYAISSES